MKTLRFLALAFAFLILHTATAAPMVLKVRTYDPDTEELKTTFHPGDTVLVRAEATFNDQALAGRPMALSIKATAKIAGIRMPYNFGTQVSLLNNKKDSTDPIAKSGGGDRYITIPSDSPNVTASLTVRATIGSAHATSTTRITIKQ